jgi:hypothetical protein
MSKTSRDVLENEPHFAELSLFAQVFLKYVCTGGPKLRKWYGAPDLLPKDGGTEGEEDEPSGA